VDRNRHIDSDIEAIPPIFILPKEDLVRDALIPAFKHADGVECMIGFFSSRAFSVLAPGLATYLHGGANSPIKLIVNPFFSATDKYALEAGLLDENDAIDSFFIHQLITEDLIQQYTLRCFSHLLKTSKLEIKIAVMRGAIFHPKVWMFQFGSEKMALHGSNNMTQSGVMRNYEQISVSKSWQGTHDAFVVAKFESIFKNLWSGKDSDCLVFNLSEAIKNKIIQTYDSKRPPNEKEYLEMITDSRAEDGQLNQYEKLRLKQKTFAIPNWLNYSDPPYAHQGKAIREWIMNDYQGVLVMATGSGKTLTSLVCAYELSKKRKPLLIVIAAPYVPLVEQWVEEVEQFNLSVTNLSLLANMSQKVKRVETILRRLRFGVAEAEAIVVSHDLLCSPEFSVAIENEEVSSLLIADEAHNLGRSSFVNNIPKCYNYKLALSATFRRQYDPIGSDILEEYFGGIVSEFELKDAIGNCLVEYDYFVHPVYLNEDELDKWKEITHKIKQSLWKLSENESDPYLNRLFIKRRSILELAQSKIGKLAELLDEETGDYKHTLIYTSDKGPKQLDEVNNLLNERSIMFHQLTANETANRKVTASILKAFADGDIQMLTAKRVLDEGVNIPQIKKAYVLASTTVERQWVQRRGRLLRRCPSIGKEKAEIHDFLTLPPDYGQGLDQDSKSILTSELNRLKEFILLAKNAGSKDGALPVVQKLIETLYY